MNEDPPLNPGDSPDNFRTKPNLQKGQVITDVAVQDPSWNKKIPNLKILVEETVTAIFGNPFVREKAPGGEILEISICFADDSFVGDLNKGYCGIDAATNVLSFPAHSAKGAPPSGKEVLLGDVVLASGVISNEAERQKKALKAHVTHLLVHGVLHLLGFDHKNKSRMEEMEALEIQILKQMNISNPYHKDENETS